MRQNPPSQPELLAGERERLEECSREPIRTPGSIQPHGAFVTVDPAGSEILQASTSCADVLGVAAGELLGRPLAELFEPGSLRPPRGSESCDCDTCSLRRIRAARS